MKKVILVVSFFVCLLSAAQNNNPSARKNIRSDSTGFGTPDGKLVNKEIGSAGGRIASEDGRIELIFPAGALTETKTISIQPITNPFDSASGKAYRFEPSGTRFKKPVQIIFQYNDAENETCPADLMGFAMQDRSGKWTPLEYDDWDSTAKTLKGYIQHFSSFTNVFNLKIEPHDHLISVNDSTTLLVVNRGVILDTGSYKGMHELATLNSGSQRDWFANGVGGGNAFEGKVHDHAMTTTMGKETYLMGTYHAPWYLPKKNPVKVSLAVRYYSKKLGKYLWRSCHTKIGVYDSYKVSVIHEATGREDMGARIIDSASFEVTVFPPMSVANRRIYVHSIKNYVPVVLKHGKNGPFKENILVDGVPGSIDITAEIRSDKISSDYPPEVYFEFVHRKILWHKSQYKARGIVSETVPIYSMSIPSEVSFMANGLPQIISMNVGREKYKVIVTPLK